MLSFASATGNLFNRLGKAGLIIKAVTAYQASQYPNMASSSSGIVGQLNSEPDLQAVFGGSYLGYLTGVEGASRQAQSLAQSVLNRMIYRDNPQPGQTLTSGSNKVNLKELIRQMKAAGATVLAMTITATPQFGSYAGVGNGTVVTSVKRPFDGLVLENSFSENLLLTCIQDSYTGGATAGNENFTLKGQGQVTDPFAFNWPNGSGGSTSLRAIDGSASLGSGNLLSNSDFETWSAGLPVGWSAPAGASLFTQGATVYTGSSSLQITGDGSTQGVNNNCLQQQVSLFPWSQYSTNLFLRRDGSVPASGNLTVDLADQNGNQIRDANGVINAFNIDLTGLNTNFAPYNIAFRTPQILPTSIFYRAYLNTFLTTGRAVFVDKASFGSMTQAYTSGPYVAVHAGSIPFQLNDFFVVLVVNSRGAGGTLSTFQTLMAQVFPEIITQEFLIPSAASPSISDSLIG